MSMTDRLERRRSAWEGTSYSGFRVDFGIDNLTDKSYLRHLSLIDEAGRNFKASVSYRF
jgi:hemoglobin/transferrin/lactoferrin receptor protein